MKMLRVAKSGAIRVNPILYCFRLYYTVVRHLRDINVLVVRPLEQFLWWSSLNVYEF